MQKRINYQGISGAYSHIAAQYLFPDGELIGKDSFQDVFLAPSKNPENLAILPVDNTVIGSIYEVYDLLFEHRDLHITGEIMLKINHNLLAHKSVSIDEIKTVYSHTKALDQCVGFFRAHSHLERVPYKDTAGAAKYVAEIGSRDMAAIASLSAAKEYHLSVLERSIQSNGENYTRFVVLADRSVSARTAKESLNKTSIVFSAAHSPGSLLSCMKPFAEGGVNLTKIESRPYIGKPWQYLFFLDFEHYGGNDEIKELIKEVKPHTQILRTLGTYPKGDTICERQENDHIVIEKCIC